MTWDAPVAWVTTAGEADYTVLAMITFSGWRSALGI